MKTHTLGLYWNQSLIWLSIRAFKYVSVQGISFQLLYFTNAGLVQCKDHFLPRCFFSSPRCGSTISWVLLLSDKTYASFFLSWVRAWNIKLFERRTLKLVLLDHIPLILSREFTCFYLYIFFYNNYFGQQIHRSACWLLNNHQDSPQLVCCIIFAWIKLSMKRLSIQTGAVAANWSEAWTSVP